MVIVIIELTQNVHTILLFLVTTWSLFYATLAQSAAEPVVPRTLPDTGNPSLAILLVVLVFAFFITAFCSIYISHCSENYVVSGGNQNGPKGIDPQVLASFPIMVYSNVKNLKTMGRNVALQCAVCLGEFNDIDQLRLLPKCCHVFHTLCIDAWLACHVTCPVCRAMLKPECGEVAVEIEGESNARHVFDESSLARGGVFEEGNEGEGVGNADGCFKKENGSSKMRAFGVLVRSHSTGHSLVEPGKGLEERFTLRLNVEEVMRKQILDDKGGSLMRRSASYDVVLQQSEEGCSGKGGWLGKSEGGEGSSKGKNRWVLSMTPPFVSRGWGSSGSGTASTCSGIPRLWASSSIVREDKESEGRRTLFYVL